MDKLPELSIVVPVYNSGHRIDEYLRSIDAAKLPSFELLLIDDGSEDDSGKIIDFYAQSHAYAKSFHTENGGPSAARNFGMAAARGRFICFHDSDDYINPEIFAGVCSFLDKYNTDITASDFYRVADNGAVLDRVFQIPSTDEPQTGRDIFLKFVTSGDCVWNTWRYIYKADFLKANSLRFSEGYNCGEDLEFTVRALSAAENIAFFHAPYYNYRVSYGNTLTRNYSAERVRQLMAMLESARNVLEPAAEPAERALLAMLGREYLLNLSLLYEVPADEREKCIGYMRDARELADDARGVYKFAAVFSRVFGMKCAAGILIVMKRLKRRVRTYRQRKYCAEGVGNSPCL